MVSREREIIAHISSREFKANIIRYYVNVARSVRKRFSYSFYSPVSYIPYYEWKLFFFCHVCPYFSKIYVLNIPIPCVGIADTRIVVIVFPCSRVFRLPFRFKGEIRRRFELARGNVKYIFCLTKNIFRVRLFNFSKPGPV